MHKEEVHSTSASNMRDDNHVDDIKMRMDCSHCERIFDNVGRRSNVVIRYTFLFIRCPTALQQHSIVQFYY